jgi:hypothetical protein
MKYGYCDMVCAVCNTKKDFLFGGGVCVECSKIGQPTAEERQDERLESFYQ